MLVVVADTSPIRYLIQIGEVSLVAPLFESVTIPSTVAKHSGQLASPPFGPSCRTGLDGIAPGLVPSSRFGRRKGFGAGYS